MVIAAVLVVFLTVDQTLCEPARPREDVKIDAHRFHAFESKMIELRNVNPNKTYLYSIGKSIENRDMWVLALANEKPDETVSMRPDVKLIATLNGAQAQSKNILMQLADYMLRNQNTDPDVDFIMRNTRVHLLPVANPDGMVRSVENLCENDTLGRPNANNVDMDQNFNDFFKCIKSPVQPETKALATWFHHHKFTLSAHIHTGNVVVYYPFDDYPGSPDGSFYSATAYDNEFKAMSLDYTATHPYMRKLTCPGKRNFTNGIVRLLAYAGFNF
mgnify:CR=1 FL=1